MKFRTEIKIAPYAPKARIGYSNRILALGSCFADQMSARLRHLHFDCTTNPTGVLFNPFSIAAALRNFAEALSVQRTELHETEGVWHHFDFHGSLSALSPDEALAQMNAARTTGTKALRDADRLLLTFGTAWVYKKNGQIVANCHHHPATEFTRCRLTVAEIVAEFAELFDTLLTHRQIILTVSPVRHIGDGLEDNALSKATLRLAAAELTERFPQVHYFPAYEILNDDLRDYRFYADDLVHPAPQAVTYIWEQFVRTALTDEAQQLLPIVNQIVTAAAHRPQHPSSESFRAFCRKQLAQITALPQINFTEEHTHFEKYLK
ncbi:MAG: GSCFA domain-containing protein [Alistipes sp.]